MKAIILSFLFISSVYASETVNPKEHTCENMQMMLEKKGTLKVKLFLFLKKRIYSPSYSRSQKICEGFDEQLFDFHTRTMDVKRCHIGQFCHQDFDFGDDIIDVDWPR